MMMVLYFRYIFVLSHTAPIETKGGKQNEYLYGK